MTASSETQRVVEALLASTIDYDKSEMPDFAEAMNVNCGQVREAAALITRQKEDIAKLREALAGLMSNDPIIEGLLWDDFADDQTGTFTITVGRIRAARAALEATK